MIIGHSFSLLHDTPQQNKLAALARIGWLLILAMVGLGGAGCGISGIRITGSGQTVTKEYELTGFSRLSIGNAFQAEITQAPAHRVAVTVDDNLVEYLDVAVSGETLRIRMQPGLNLHRATMKATIALPSLAGLDLNGAVRATVTGVNSDKPLEAEVSGASQLRGDIKNGDARFDISGASRIELRGRAETLRITASGASHANLEAYGSSNTVAQASGASHVTVDASGKLEAHASGASSVRYVGEPSEVISHTSGASSVRKK